MRLPVDRRSIEVSIDLLIAAVAAEAESAPMLVLIEIPISVSSHAPWGAFHVAEAVRARLGGSTSDPGLTVDASADIPRRQAPEFGNDRIGDCLEGRAKKPAGAPQRSRTRRTASS